MKKLSTISEYGAYIPLLLKLKNSKMFNLINTPFSSPYPIKLDYEKMIVTDNDITRSVRKFIIIKN